MNADYVMDGEPRAYPNNPTGETPVPRKVGYSDSL